MKTLFLGFMLFIWMLFTLILTFSIIGTCLFGMRSYGEPSTWMRIGLDLKNKLIS